MHINRRSLALKKTWKPLLAAMLTLLSVASMSTVPQKADALSGSQFSAGRIIDDVVFYNNNSMSSGQIQQFLNAKVPACDTNGTQMHSSGQTRAQYGASRGYPAPYTCLKDYHQAIPGVTNSGSDLCKGSVSGGTKSAAQIIYDVAQACGVSPQVLIVLLQKEQSLVTDDWPWSIQYRSATGYGCPDTAPCDSEFYGFFNQVYQAAKGYKRYQANPANYNYRAGRNNVILWNPNAACGNSTVYIENQATAGLYIYTPYRPNQAALNNLYGTGDGCSSYGNRNFWRMFSDWFGNTYGTIHNGVDYKPVFDAEYYLNQYPDLRTAFGTDGASVFRHFIVDGMREGRQASENFNVTSYRNRYTDLRFAFGSQLPRYYAHYALTGMSEGRLATGVVPLVPVTSYVGVDYSAVYDFATYKANYADIDSAFGDDDAGAMLHFVVSGMKEGRSAKVDFNVNSYRIGYFDLRRAFGDDLPSYYLHYIYNGRAEGRVATGSTYRGTSTLDGVDYSSVYDFGYYVAKYPDVKRAFDLDDISTLRHFLVDGMNEGRQGSESFNVHAYRTRYSDLRNAFGIDLKSYYIHYLVSGKSEGRIGN